MIICQIVATSLSVLAFSVNGFAGEVAKPLKPISQQEATRIALSKVPGGSIESAKLEKEGATLLWSVDVKIPDSKNITEVHIEAQTGKVLSVEIETPAQQAAEIAADKRKLK